MGDKRKTVENGKLKEKINDGVNFYLSNDNTASRYKNDEILLIEDDNKQN